MGKRKGLFLVFFITTVALGLVVGKSLAQKASGVGEAYESLKVFTDALSLIQKNYVEKVNSKDLVYGAMKGMLEGLDPHSSFMNPDTFKEMQVDTRGEFGGLGIEITMKDGILTVVSPIEDTPAFKAGIKAGDIIIKIDGKGTKDLTLMDAVKMMRGPKGTQVTITVVRETFAEPRDFTVTRDIIAVKSVKSKTLESGYGYVRVAQFQEKTDTDLDNVLDKMEKENGGLKGLVLDMRNNPGGLLDQAVKVSDDFLESGLIVYTDGRIEGQKMTFSAKKEGIRPNYPIVVLVNSGSASASEIVAGALQDHGRALILGTQTFGKGSVQTIYPLEDGSALRLTTARYYTPSGRSIQAKGITPDIILETEKVKKALPRAFREVREKDLDGHLLVPGAKPEKEEKTDKPKGKEEKAEAQIDAEPEDIQLNRALELLKSWQVFQKTIKKG
ncbi:MAG: S41 family peptidase [Deltaproteobacteria bacterium]|nr:S41 family peptidase [Deltaproteobacteria bacterium]